MISMWRIRKMRNYSFVNSNRLDRWNIEQERNQRFISQYLCQLKIFDKDIVDVDVTKWADIMNDVQCGCLTYKYSLIAVILVPIICTLSMSLLVSLASTVPTTINNRFRFNHDVLRRRVFGESFSVIAKLLSENRRGNRDRLSDRRNMDREQFVVFF